MIVLYFFYMKSKDLIINYPSWIYYTLFLLIVFFLLINLLRDKNRIQNYISDKFQITLKIVQQIIVSWFVAGIVLIPFNYYILIKTEGNNVEFKSCPIIGVSTFSKNRCVFYSLDGHTNVLYGYIPIMEEMNTNKQWQNYRLILNVKKGLLNTYVMKDWNINKIERN